MSELGLYTLELRVFFTPPTVILLRMLQKKSIDKIRLKIVYHD